LRKTVANNVNLTWGHTMKHFLAMATNRFLCCNRFIPKADFAKDIWRHDM